jgi:protein-L-isoaspartate(D-aspartate) O-methyltransferase
MPEHQNDDDVRLQRRFFAEEVQMIANLRTPRLVDAFAQVPREQFLRPGPWLIRGEGDFGAPARSTPDAHPRHVSHNIVVAIDPARQLFNGQPSTLGTWIDALMLQPGDRVLHVGCGLGYYSALMAWCVGEAGRVVAIDVDEPLVTEARANLSMFPQVEVRCGDGVTLDGGTAVHGAQAETFDAILINAGMSHPHDAWLAALRPGGRLILPLTCPFPQMGPTIGKGVVLMIKDRRERQEGQERDAPAATDAPRAPSAPHAPEALRAPAAAEALDARLLTFVAIYSALGIRDAVMETALAQVMARNPWPAIKRLRRDAHEPSASCWLHGATFCISLE